MLCVGIVGNGGIRVYKGQNAFLTPHRHYFSWGKGQEGGVGRVGLGTEHDFCKCDVADLLS